MSRPLSFNRTLESLLHFSFSAGSLNGKLMIHLILAYLVKLTLLAVIEVRADSRRDVPTHCVSALALARKGIELVEKG